MKVKRLIAKKIKDTRNEDTIEIFLKTNFGEFIASAPNGKSKGVFEVKSWKKSLLGDITAVNNYFIEEINLNEFNDLKLIEKSFRDIIGGNTIIALECVFLKALAKEHGKEVWELINPKASRMPFLIGNAIGGGLHSHNKNKPEFQEFQFIPMTNIAKAVEINKFAWENCKIILKNIDGNFKAKLNDENAWQTSLNNNQVIEVMKQVRDNIRDEFKVNVHLGIDVAASSFYKEGKYLYKNSKSKKLKNEQIKYMQELAKDIFYLEDPFEENDFKGFKELKKFSKGLVTGDDLITTNLDRIIFAHKNNSINAVIIKPNQIGSLFEVKKVVDFCKNNGIKTVFSHRSGETSDDILADLAFGFQADFAKIGISGEGSNEKLDRLIWIEDGRKK